MRRSTRAETFTTQVEPHLSMLYRLAYRFTGQRADAEDLVQDLLAQLYARRTDLAGIDALRPWLARALYHLFIDRLRRRRHDPLNAAGDLEALQDHADPHATPDTDAEQRRLRTRLEAAIQRLAPEQRAVIALHDIEGYTLQELVGVLDAPLGTLKSRLHRARAAVRQAAEMQPFSVEQRVSL